MKRTACWGKIVAGFAAVSLLLAGCGSAQASYDGGYKSAEDSTAMAAAGVEPGYYADEEAYYEYDTDDVYEAEAEEAAASTENAEILEENAQSSGRKLIKNVTLNVETEEFDKFLANIDRKVNALGGYVESSEVSGRSLYNTATNRYASITVRIPNDRMDDFVASVTEQSNITSKNISTDDVTLEYADTKAHIDSLKEEQKRLNDLIAMADDLDTLLKLEARLTEVSYQVESYERQIRSLDNKVDYATIMLYVNEVTHYTPVEQEPLSAGERISRGLSENLYKIGIGFREFGIGFVIALPYIILALLFVGLLALVIILIVKVCIKKAKKNEEKRRSMMQARQAAQQNRVQPKPQAPAKGPKPAPGAVKKEQANGPEEQKPETDKPEGN